ncbi:hypothetical protein HBI56_145590 [Parastagonospora nodorum]|nr:hypothetical protein HBI76_115250 [Parastagonospora nodorum]KAH5066026.1 hypothetical protein HBI73_199160 [Parastagonospora nodorum]KAH5088741.1 hypothetical protein HBH72_242920 [Parastagonospora nodorum]KAH5234046.1 hypothetical protein HBI62_050020 [Parastagonospora nodorum]KAH5325803.1 hypothetical protein HBI11_033450 [Parastagonospora nodorum]
MHDRRATLDTDEAPSPMPDSGRQCRRCELGRDNAAQPLTAAAAVALVAGLLTYVVRVRFGNDMEWAGAGVLAAKVACLGVLSCGLASREHQGLPLDFAEDATGKEHRPLSDDSLDVLDFTASVIWTREPDWNIVAGAL